MSPPSVITSHEKIFTSLSKLNAFPSERKWLDYIDKQNIKHLSYAEHYLLTSRSIYSINELAFVLTELVNDIFGNVLIDVPIITEPKANKKNNDDFHKLELSLMTVRGYLVVNIYRNFEMPGAIIINLDLKSLTKNTKTKNNNLATITSTDSFHDRLNEKLSHSGNRNYSLFPIVLKLTKEMNKNINNNKIKF